MLVGEGEEVTRARDNLLLDEFQVPVSLLFHKPNFYTLEYTDEGVAYAWTGPSPDLEFQVPVERDSEKIFRLSFISAIEELQVTEAKAFVDNQSAFFRIDCDGKARGIVIAIPPCKTQCLTEITVQLKRTVSPSEIGQGVDGRQLGLAVTGYDVFRPRTYVSKMEVNRKCEN
ncbi:hypothetical protein [Microbulbifer sp. YPW16]|uniref:hypothetical protein n=1 Tax=Microbulbifer sp. YPW16 TaxID=2904242 RepID=UPI001E63A69E|nr:hypothetical protein [Microbulbifer sp. YPW16]UHQ55869.1 hypothetical protein LVE68_02445 [Microbulbifer sp. YPW16]